jgi:hypothetical protein
VGLDKGQQRTPAQNPIVIIFIVGGVTVISTPLQQTLNHAKYHHSCEYYTKPCGTVQNHAKLYVTKISENNPTNARLCQLETTLLPL